MGVNIVLLIGANEDDDSSLFKTFNYCSSFNFNGIVSGVLAYAIGIKGTPLSAGFGYTGLVGPINAFNRMSGDATIIIILLVFGYFVIPFVSAFIIHEICKN